MRREKPASHQPENTSVVPTDDAALRARCASNAPRTASSGTDCIATRRAYSLKLQCSATPDVHVLGLL